MKKILLSAAAFAVFMSATPANALFSGSKTEMTTTFGSDYATKLANADVYANNIKNLLSQLYEYQCHIHQQMLGDTLVEIL